MISQNGMILFTFFIIFNLKYILLEESHEIEIYFIFYVIKYKTNFHIINCAKLLSSYYPHHS